MSTRQYIGARYVPKFFDWDGSAEWRQGVAYEALTIVTRNGNSYTSKVPVPSNVGAPEDNTDYWVSTGLFNAQVEAIRELAQNTANTLDGFMANGAIGTDNLANDAVTTDKVADNAITSDQLADNAVGTGQILNYAVTASKIADNAVGTGKLNNGAVTADKVADNAITTSKIQDGSITPNKLATVTKYALFLGDSYVQAASLGTDQNQRWSTLLSALLGVTEYNYAVGGSGFFAGTTISTQESNAWAAISSTANDVEYVIISSGRNDANEYPEKTHSQIQTAVEPVMATIHTHYPNAKIFYIPMLFDANVVPMAYAEYYYKLVNAVTKIPYVSLFEYAYNILRGRYDYILIDGVHPNVNGHKVICRAIWSAINGGDMIETQYARKTADTGWNGVFAFRTDASNFNLTARINPLSQLTPGWFIDDNVGGPNDFCFCYLGYSVDFLMYGSDGSVVPCQLLNYNTGSRIRRAIYNYKNFEQGVVYSCDFNVPFGIKMTAN